MSSGRYDGTYDDVVVGIGAVGSATVWQLTRRDRSVLALERNDVPGPMGSTHRVAAVHAGQYSSETTHALYTDSLETWRERESKATGRLLTETGWLYLAPSESRLIERTRRNCDRNGVTYGERTASACSSAFDGYDVPDDYVCLFEHRAGILDAERGVTSMIADAIRLGADVRGRERVTSWSTTADGVVVTTTKGRYQTDRLAVTIGSWSPTILPLESRVRVTRQPMAWFRTVSPNQCRPDPFPPGSVTTPDGEYTVYPQLEGFSLKVEGPMDSRESIDPETASRTPRQTDEDKLSAVAETFVADGAGPTLSLRTRFVTVTPDREPIIDRHPSDDRVVFATGFGGHGLSLAPAVGDLLADLCVDGSTDYDVDSLTVDRFDG